MPVGTIAVGDTSPDTGAGGSFFPRGAYIQVNAISNPAADYRNRLIALVDLDTRALHLRVGPGATLLGVDVPDRSATWVTPGLVSVPIARWFSGRRPFQSS